MNELDPGLFENVLLTVLDETFDDVKGIYLDGGASLFETLGNIDAATASRPVVPGGTSIAGHVEHIRWYLEISEGYINGERYEGFEWKTTWQVKVVSDDEWAKLIGSLRTACSHFVEFIKGFDSWNVEDRLGGAFGVLAHTAYHLGAIRQLVRVVQP